MGLYYYESHLGSGIYTSSHHYSYNELYCEECGDSDTEIGYFDTPEDFVRYYVKYESYVDFYNEEELEEIKSLTLELCKEYDVDENNYESLCQEMYDYFKAQLKVKEKIFKEISSVEHSNEILETLYNDNYKQLKLKQLRARVKIEDSLDMLCDVGALSKEKDKYYLSELACKYLNEKIDRRYL